MLSHRGAAEPARGFSVDALRVGSHQARRDAAPEPCLCAYINRAGGIDAAVVARLAASRAK